MRLAALVESIDHVCCRYRLRAFQAGLENHGHTLALHELPRSWWGRLGIGRSLCDTDVVILQRRLLSQLELALLRKRVKRLLFDFDDGIWMRDSYSPKGFISRKRSGRFRSIMRKCDGAVAGNSFLAQHALENGARQSIIIPTCVDVNRYPVATHSRLAGQAELVWVGSSSTLSGLESITGLLETIGSANRGVSLKLICDRFFTLKHLPVVPCVWSETNETDEIAGADIGLAWIPDDPWSRGKCGLKVLQYMAAALPVIANPVGVHTEMVEHGVTGFIARTEQDWLEAVRILAANPPLRRKMGQAARSLVHDRYSVEVGVSMWAAILDNLAPHRVSA